MSGLAGQMLHDIGKLSAQVEKMRAAIEQVLAHVENPDIPRVQNQCTLCHTYRTILRESLP